VFKFINLLFENNKVKTSTSRNKIEIINGTKKEKEKSILKIFVTKIYENIIANIKDVRIIGRNIIKDSNIINLIVFDFSNPKMVKTKFW
tara:strand:+ start:86 stop:352 length:267 start_codon:yes stop_codon:yes gene_type:complete